MELAKELISQYGYVAIYALLSIGILGMPLPDEILLTFVGYLCSTRVLHYGVALLCSFSGAVTGGLVSYWLGSKLGRPGVQKYGGKIGIHAKRLERVEKWFIRYGAWSIILGYFIPGIRHLMCCFSGISRMRFGKYLILSASGALLWSVVFITIGYYTIGCFTWN